MATRRILITDFTQGMVSPRFGARVDLPLQTKALEEITGFVVAPDGGVRRSPGSLFVKTGLGFTPPSDSLYDANGIPGLVVFSRLASSVEVPWIGYLKDDDDFEAFDLQNRTAQTIALTSLPYGRPLYGGFGKYLHDPDDLTAQELHIWTEAPSGKSFLVDVEAWTAAEQTVRHMGWPFKNRKIAVNWSSGKIWMSEILDLNDFATNQDEVGDHIEALPDFAGAEIPLWVAARGSVYVGTDQAEYEVFSVYPYFSGQDAGGVVVSRVSQVGASHAFYHGGGLILLKDFRLIRMGYQGGNENRYVASSLMELVDNAKLITACSIEYGAHRYIFALDINQVLWGFTEAPASGVGGWFQIATDVDWVTSFKQDLYVVRQRSSAYWCEVYPLDNLTMPGNRSDLLDLAWQRRYVHGNAGGFIIITDAAVTGDTLPASATVSAWRLEANQCVALADRSTTAGGALSGTVGDIQTWAGHSSGNTLVWCHLQGAEPTSSLKTLPMIIPAARGVGLGVPGTVSKVILRVWESRAAKVRANGGAWVTWQETGSARFTGFKELTVTSPRSAEIYVEVDGVDEEPLNIMQIEVEIDQGGM